MIFYQLSIRWPEAKRYLVIGEELFEGGSGWEVSERRDDSEDKTFHIWSQKWTLVLYRPKPAAQKHRDIQQWINSVNCISQDAIHHQQNHIQSLICILTKALIRRVTVNSAGVSHFSHVHYSPSTISLKYK